MNKKLQSQTQVELSIPAREIVNGFCYAFSKALLIKLKSLMEENRMFDDLKNFTPIANAIIQKLALQTDVSGDNCRRNLKKFVEDIEEFLAIFEKKE